MLERIKALITRQPIATVGASITAGDCVEWTGWINKGGYGLVRAGAGRGQRAHRWAWIQARGPIPKGLVVCHACDNRRCINVDHLWLGTLADNVRDMDVKGRRGTSPGRHNARYTHPETTPVGTRNGNARLAESDIPAIRALLQSGVPKQRIADAFGVSRTPICQIARGRTWKHV